MEKQEILKFCIKNGFFVDKNVLNFFIGKEKDHILEIISKLKKLGVSDKILTCEILEKYKISQDSQFNNNVKILKNFNENPSRVSSGDFVDYFRARFESLRNILIRKKLDNLVSIRRIGSSGGVFVIIAMIFNKKITKNKNLLIEVEDLTGRTVVLVNRDNKKLFEQAKNLLLDDVVAIKVSGSDKMLFASEFIYPDSKIESEKFSNKEEFVAFSGDFHVGSNVFLESNLLKFISWLNGEVGDKRKRELALKVKYLILAGDNIEGVGVYPGQEKFLKIEGCRGQYEKLIEILSKIRKDVKIIMCPGQHDAVWVGEPQPKIHEKWISGIGDLGNLTLVSNPSLIELGNLKILICHSSNLNKFIDQIDEIRINYGHRNPARVVEEILKRRHLAPVYGEMDIVPSKNGDYLVLEEVPDVFVIGGQHRAMVGNYNNIAIVSTSSWQHQTEFEKKTGHRPDPCKVPILNLKNRELKILDFGGEEVKLGERE